MSSAVRILAILCVLGIAAPIRPAYSQASPQTPAASNPHQLIPLATPSVSPAVLELMRLEGDFEKAVEKGGGKAFAAWFAEDGITLNNGRPAVQGQRAIAAQAAWDPKDYQLMWYPEGAQMGPSGDSGFTWGHYEAHGHDAKGQPTVSSGRYITFWKKVNGTWKVALDASANEPPASTH